MDAVVSYFGKRDFPPPFYMHIALFLYSRESKAQETYSSHGVIVGDTFIHDIYVLVHSISLDLILRQLYFLASKLHHPAVMEVLAILSILLSSFLAMVGLQHRGLGR